VVAVVTAIAVLMVPTRALPADKNGREMTPCDYDVAVTSVKFCEAELDDRRTAYMQAGGLVILTLLGTAGVLTRKHPD
jgi:hypothetical protein